MGTTTLIAPRELSMEGIVHKPCAFNRNGVSARTCHDTTRVFRHNERCAASNCASKLRACKACLHQGGDIRNVVNPVSGLCTFHETNGADARPKREDLLTVIERAQHAKMPQAQAQRTYEPVNGKDHTPEAEPPRLKIVTEEDIPDEEAVVDDSVFVPLAPTVARSTESMQALQKARQAVAAAVPVEIEPQKIRRMPNQPRKSFDPAEITSLAEGITQDGQLQRGLVRPIPMDDDGHTHELIDGERRWLAVLEAGIPFYRANQADMDDDAAAAYLISIALNFNRVDHTPLEKAEAIEYMNDVLGMTYDEIGKTMGHHPVELSKFRSLLRLVPQVRAMLDGALPKKKQLPVGVAISISLQKPHLQLTTAQRYFRKELSSGAIHRMSQDTHYRSSDVIGVRVPPLADQWHKLAKRAKAIEEKIVDLTGLIGTTRNPPSDEPLAGRVQTIQTLRLIKQRADEALAALKVKP